MGKYYQDSLKGFLMRRLITSFIITSTLTMIATIIISYFIFSELYDSKKLVGKKIIDWN